ncbi:MAG: PEP-CTERM sorting domain-containing protein [Planctomycetes bacterium]|nr:PEP-CTERM sorting domain-containing protein [Planctomycetota bacterium]
MRTKNITRAMAVMASLALIALLPSWGSAATLTVNLAGTEITALSLSGSGSLPLSTDIGNTQPGSIDNYGYLDTSVLVTESPLYVSTGQATVSITPTANPLVYTFNVTSTINLYADVTLTDADAAHNFATGLTSPVTLLAPSTPLSVQLIGSFDASVDDLLSTPIDFTPSISSSEAIYPLGVDINGNNAVDVLTLQATNLNLSLQSFTLSDLSVDSATILSFLLGNDVEVNANVGLSITGANATFDGQVVDVVADPPFSIELEGPVISRLLDDAGPSSVPEPSTFVLAALGLAGLGLVAWKRRRVRG